MTRSRLLNDSLTQDQRYAPSDLRWLFSKFFGELVDGQGYGEEIKGVPCPGQEGDQEEQPLGPVQQSDQLERIRSLGHGWFQCGQPGREVRAHAHLLRSCRVGLQRIPMQSLIVGNHFDLGKRRRTRE